MQDRYLIRCGRYTNWKIFYNLSEAKKWCACEAGLQRDHLFLTEFSHYQGAIRHGLEHTLIRTIEGKFRWSVFVHKVTY